MADSRDASFGLGCPQNRRSRIFVPWLRLRSNRSEFRLCLGLIFASVLKNPEAFPLQRNIDKNQCSAAEITDQWQHSGFDEILSVETPDN
jgi:hypothetical protein